MDPYQITFESWDKVAKKYQEVFMDFELYNNSYDLFLTTLSKPNVTILEIGCGPGNITSYLLNKKPTLNIEAYDIAPSMIELAKINNPTATCGVLDAREIQTLSSLYDAILCGFCLPYLANNDVSQFIHDSYKLLQPNGILYLSTLEGDYETSGYITGSTGDQMYVYYHSETTLRTMLNRHSFELIEIIRKPYSRADGSQEIHLIVLSRKL
ncbi:class I SAM-dependent DNA methyltransferase [Aquimarina intermedia]|uniref:Ubiquinone/menaquinone biosynthesis C-methylase UbiE n=1 Tax=Aquimarina intermedia TaxID=350814 RepID=A0A5S5C2Q4_9FLAO|nr:class I SAM-dependent methyltransferase [Aquimarina intermedia]TYP72253.1 ubiquinone/menaquinone biosynthesis C-methylase UbiE [Aquimarina intermedia]